jgi:hypothetical protein
MTSVGFNHASVGKINMNISNIRKDKVKHITAVISINTLSQTKKTSQGANSISPELRIKLKFSRGWPLSQSKPGTLKSLEE